MKDQCIGSFLLITEPNGGVTVYDQDSEEEEHVFHGSPAEARRFVFDQLGEVDPEEPEPRQARPTPCRECPFRRKAAPGWLGGSHPEGFVSAILADVDLPCHMTIDYERPDWKERWDAQVDPKNRVCAGSLVLKANTCQVPRKGSLLTRKADRESVFGNHAAFIEHHRASPNRSWTEPSDNGEEAAVIRMVRARVGLPPLKKS